MAALSQCLDDSPAKWAATKPPAATDLNLQELYNESHRLALEELVSCGVDKFVEFLRKERIPNFLSDEETRRLVRGAVVPRSAAAAAASSSSTLLLLLGGEDGEQSAVVSSSMDCSSLTYFPEISDVEPPLLELGWPAFTTGSYRGVTRAVAHFQPSYGERIYCCKEAARRMIKSAKEVIAIVTDSLTDLDIFKDLQEACTRRNVPVYVLLDQSSMSAFLRMCGDIGVRLEDLRQMRVRSLSGTTYYLRSGASISGKVHERFMLIDGNRVATGSYRFNWTDGRLNSSNLVELSGQVTEKFDEEFRILYAQSLPLSAQVLSRARPSSVHEHHHLLLKHPNTAFSPHSARDRPSHTLLLTSTPGRNPRALAMDSQPTGDLLTAEFNSSVLGDEWAENQQQQQQHHIEEMPEIESAPPTALTPSASSEVATQTCCVTVDCGSQTEPGAPGEPHGPHHSSNNIASSSSPTTLTRTTSAAHCEPTTSPTQDPAGSCPGELGCVSPAQRRRKRVSNSQSPVVTCDPTAAAAASSSDVDTSLWECFNKLSRERQQQYASIRGRLESMASVLSRRRELADVTNVTAAHLVAAPARPRAPRECGKEQGTGLLPGQHVCTGTWPRARCLH
ncbi:hypothetical protein CRUP_028543 [Coryphaenoides rupestris]|nr:hypothetical protein CRUP_028543 [Coryphaenoides rupestris]